MQNHRYSPKAKKVLIAAGWFPGRDVFHQLELPTEFSIFPKAKLILSEFGSLKIGGVGAGRDCSTSDFLVEPELAVGLGHELEVLERLHGSKLYPLGEAHNRHFLVLVDEHGRIFFDAEGRLQFMGTSFDEAIENMIDGVKPVPTSQP